MGGGWGGGIVVSRRSILNYCSVKMLFYEESLTDPFLIAMDIAMEFHSKYIFHCSIFTTQENITLVSSTFVYSLIKAQLTAAKKEKKLTNTENFKQKFKQSNIYVHAWKYQKQCVSLWRIIMNINSMYTFNQL